MSQARAKNAFDVQTAKNMATKQLAVLKSQKKSIGLVNAAGSQTERLEDRLTRINLDKIMTERTEDLTTKL